VRFATKGPHERESLVNPTTRRQFLRGAGALAGMGIIGGAIIELEGAEADAGTLPQLIITKVIVPAHAKTGQHVRFGVVIRNEGAAATPVGKEIVVTFRVGGRTVTSTRPHRVSLEPRTSITLYAGRGGWKDAGTWISTGGTHTCTATVNDPPRFPERNPRNNSKRTTFRVTGREPVNTVAPRIIGVAEVGRVLTCLKGSWSTGST
jgi:hypothetical protein